MCIKVRKARGGWTLVEMMFALGIFSLGGIAIAAMFIFGVRAMAALTNYSVLDQYNRQAMDLVTSELRQAQQVTGYTSNATSRVLTFTGGDGQSVSYTFDSSKQQVRRTDSASTRILLTNCNLLNFNLYMRPPPPPTNSVFDGYTAVTNGANWAQTVKVVQFSWKTSIRLSPTANINSEDIQTACVVIRKQPNSYY